MGNITKKIGRKLEMMWCNNSGDYKLNGEWISFLSSVELDGMIYIEFPDSRFNEVKNKCKKIATIISSKH